MRSRRSVLGKLGTAATTAGIVGLAGCTGDGDGGGDGSDGDGGDGSSDTVMAAYVYDEPIADIGWTNTHEVAREALESEYDWYETQVVEDISPSEAETTFTDLAEQGVDIIEAATFDYGTPAATVVQEYDDLFTETPRMVPVEGYSGPQLGYYLGQLEDACYATGVAAGMLTESNTLGYVMPFDIASTITELNALMQGVKSVNEDAELIIRYTDSWYDPPAEREAAEALVDEGADVLGYRVSTPTTMEVAAENDLWSYGYADSFIDTDIAYDKYITSRMWDWSAFYDATATAAHDGNLMGEDRFNIEPLRGLYFGMESGGVTLDEFGSAVPSEVANEMDSAVEQLSSGDLTGADIFEGTQYAGQSAFERVSGADEYVDGVIN